MGDELSYGFIMPFFPLPPMIAIVCQGILAVWLIHMSWIAWIVAPVWILSGIGIYHYYSKSHAISTEDEIHVIEEEVAPSRDVQILENDIRCVPIRADATQKIARIVAITGVDFKMQVSTDRGQRTAHVRRPGQHDVLLTHGKWLFEHFFQGQ